MKKITFTLITAAVCAMVAGSAFAGVKYSDGDAYLKVGGRIQLQYHMEDPDDGEDSDELFFRRFRPYIEGSVHPDWKGKFQWDMGKSKLAVKDAYLQYKGFDNMKVSIGNMNFPFSRELITSSKKQQLVERTFVGDHNFGTPDRQTGLHIGGTDPNKVFEWNIALAKGMIDPDNDKLDFDTVIQIENHDGDNADWQEGNMAGIGIDLFPMGYMKASQGDFGGDAAIVLGASVFTWQNDDDNLRETLTFTNGVFEASGKEDVDSVLGIEGHIGLRAGGLSIDAQYNTFDAELVEDGVTSGIYEDSETTLESFAVEGGFMLIPNRLEIVGGYQSQDSDGYDDAWTRTSFGANVFVHKHDIKLQVTYRMGENVEGASDNDMDELFVQTQYVF